MFIQDTKQFIEESIKTHSNKYDYSRVVYINSKHKVSIGCPIHGIFEQWPFDHLNGRGCPECGGTKKLTTERFISKSVEKHGPRYSYDKTLYVNGLSFVTITCPIHGDFEMQAQSHLAGQGCKQCGIISRTAKRKYTTEQYVEKCKEKYSEYQFDYSKVDYQGSESRVTIICPKHGSFTRSATHFLNGGSICADCSGVKSSGFNTNKKGYLYLLKTERGFKIGVSRQDIERRLKQINLSSKKQKISFEVYHTWEYMRGKTVRSIEKYVLSVFNARYEKSNVAFNGSTETFFTDDSIENIKEVIDRAICEFTDASNSF